MVEMAAQVGVVADKAAQPSQQQISGHKHPLISFYEPVACDARILSLAVASAGSF